MAAKRLVLDGDKWRQGLQSATNGGGDTLDRVKRLNAYLASVGGRAVNRGAGAAGACSNYRYSLLQLIDQCTAGPGAG